MKPLCVDIFCGLFGWGEAFADAGYKVVGFDIEDQFQNFGKTKPENCELLLRDARSISGEWIVRTFGVPAVIVCSPPCQEFSYMAMPWSKAKEKRRKILADPAERIRLTDLFNQCFRIQREVSAAAGHYVPIVIENVRGAQEWVGKARWNFGSYFLWGDVPALMPIPSKFGLKSPGNNSPIRWEDREVVRLSGGGQDFTRIAGKQAEGIKERDADGYEYPTRNFGWKAPRTTSKSPKRKQASAEIAKIPWALASWIAKCFK